LKQLRGTPMGSVKNENGNRARSTGMRRRSASLAKGHREATATAPPVLTSMSSALVDLPLVYRQTRQRGLTRRLTVVSFGRVLRRLAALPSGEIPASKQAAMSGQLPSCDNTHLKLLPCYRLRLQTRSPAFGGFKEFAPTSEIEWNAQAKSDWFCGREN